MASRRRYHGERFSSLAKEKDLSMTDKPERVAYLLGGDHLEPYEYPHIALFEPELAAILRELPSSDEVWYVERFSAGVTIAEYGPVEVVVITSETSALRAVEPVDPRTPPTCFLDTLTLAMEEPLNVSPRRPAKVCVAKEKMAKLLRMALGRIGIEVELTSAMSPVHEGFARLTIIKRPGVD